MLKHIEKDILDDYLNKKLLRINWNDDKTLFIVDYTEHCTYENAWDEYTLNLRGSVYDKDYNLVMPGMKKFFNLFQLLPEDQKRVAEWMTNGTKFRTTMKYDGAYGLVFPYNGRLIYTSKCTFNNDIVEEFKNIVKGKLYINDLEDVSMGCICEIICPKTRQIVNYEDLKELRVIAGVNMTTGQEYDYEHTKNILDIINANNIKMVEQKEFTFDQLIKWQKTNNWEQEGFVVQNLETKERVKFKSEEYLQVAKIKADCNYTHILNSVIANSKDKDWFNITKDGFTGLPDEFQKEADSILNDIKSKYEQLYNNIQDLNKKYSSLSDKELGLNNSDDVKSWKSCIFSLRKGKNIDYIILKSIKENDSETKV